MDATQVGGPYMRAQRSGAKVHGPRVPVPGRPYPGSGILAPVPRYTSRGPVPGRVRTGGPEPSVGANWRRRGGTPQAGGTSRLPARARVRNDRSRPDGARPASALTPSHLRRQQSVTCKTNAPDTNTRPWAGYPDRRAGRQDPPRPTDGSPGGVPPTWVRRGGMKPRAAPSRSALAHSASAGAASMLTEPPAFSTAATADLVA